MENNKFSYTYSAPTDEERKEIESIRRRYKPESFEESKVARLRRLHSMVTGRATAFSLALGILGLLVFGTGLALMLEFGMIVLGIIIGVIGIIPIAIAYPLYNFLFKIGRAKYGDEILRLSTEILGE